MDKFIAPVFIAEEDDLYSGFNEFHPTLNTATLIQETLTKDGNILQVTIRVVHYITMYAVINLPLITLKFYI